MASLKKLKGIIKGNWKIRNVYLEGKCEYALVQVVEY